jgi:enoyl-CoA hydratase/carnithine racemase
MDDVLTRVEGSLGHITLNRPKAINALTLPMVEAIAAALTAWRATPRVRAVLLDGAGERGFCAGGDIVMMRRSALDGDGAVEAFWRAEYRLDAQIADYPKPVVALMDGIVMGGGMGLAQGAQVRIVGPRTKMAMPETTIGLFPDVGGSYFLSRLPGKLGIYLGLVGPTIRAADAVYCGLADVEVPGQGKDGAPELWAARDPIDLHFSGDSVAAIVASLQSESRPGVKEWAAQTLEALAKRSPTMLCVTLEQLKRGATLSLGDCLRMELNLVHGCFDQGDLVEGIRALLVDKDNQPRWSPGSLGEVNAKDVDAFFAPRWTPDKHPLASLQ